ncbi:MAG: hypothetical protein GX269_01540 [Clostridiales bacterium]|jgi:hypothetical protein|nr:hypothetical protein [Clostridiales bacterium]
MKITNNKMFEHGKTHDLVCPSCNELVNMQILRSTSAFGGLGFSLFNYKVEYFTICPKCSSLFAVAKDAVKLAEGRTKDFSTISEPKLTFIKNLNIK